MISKSVDPASVLYMPYLFRPSAAFVRYLCVSQWVRKVLLLVFINLICIVINLDVVDQIQQYNNQGLKKMANLNFKMCYPEKVSDSGAVYFL